MTPEDKKPRGPGTSAKGKKKAEEKFARQAAALRANLKRRRQQRRGQMYVQFAAHILECRSEQRISLIQLSPHFDSLTALSAE